MSIDDNYNHIDTKTCADVTIVHITESLVGGVLFVLQMLISEQVASGFKVVLIHSARPETPPEAVLVDLFPQPIIRFCVPMVTNISIQKDLRAFKIILNLLYEINPAVIHLHSSKAGALGRLATRALGMAHRTFYSPHGLAFLRRDVSIVKRAMFLLFEMLGHLLGGTVIACSASEGNLARKVVGRGRVMVVENAISLEGIIPSTGSGVGAVKVVSAGRLCYQKAPWRFKSLASSLLQENVHFVWIGGGEDRLLFKDDICVPDNLEVTGWLEREAVLMEMQKADIFVLTSLWEGMPLALIEAQVIGLPCVVWDTVGSRDVIIDGITGFVCHDEQDFIEKTRLLILDTPLRLCMGKAGREMALNRFSSKKMHRNILQVYGVLKDAKY